VVLQQACGGRNHGPAWCYYVMSTLHTLPTDYRLPATRHRLVVTLQSNRGQTRVGAPPAREPQRVKYKLGPPRFSAQSAMTFACRSKSGCAAPKVPGRGRAARGEAGRTGGRRPTLTPAASPSNRPTRIVATAATCRAPTLKIRP
jgi:hypothetical protein